MQISRGDVYKREWEHNGKKRTAYQFSFTYTKDGVTRRVRGQAPTRAEATTAMEEKQEELRRPEPTPAPEIDPTTLDQYADRWLDQVAVNLAPRTVTSYRELLKRYVRPALGATRLVDVTRAQVKDLLAARRAAGLSKNTVRLVRATLSVLFSDAVEDGLVPVNPAAGVGGRGRKKGDAVTGAERRQKIRPMTGEQLAAFLAAVDGRRGIEAAEAGREARDAEIRRDRRDYALFLTLADAGLRPGEALGLKWDDVDLVDRTLNIQRALARGGQVKATKTGESRRVDLTSRLADVLGRWQATSEADALAAGQEDPSKWVFPSEEGTPLDGINAARRFRALLVKAKLPRFRLYDLRHSFATHLLAEGAPITYVAAQLGHAKPTTTLAFYAHWLPRGDKSIIDRLEEARVSAAQAQVGHMNAKSVVGAS
jgi:integrase